MSTNDQTEEDIQLEAIPGFDATVARYLRMIGDHFRDDGTPFRRAFAEHLHKVAIAIEKNDEESIKAVITSRDILKVLIAEAETIIAELKGILKTVRKATHS